MQTFDQLDETGAVFRVAITPGMYDRLPPGHTWVPHVAGLEAVKLERKSAVEAWRDSACVQPVIVAVSGTDHAWDADKRSQDLLGTAVSLASLSVVNPPPVWRSADNDNVPVTLEDLKNIVATIALQTQVAYGKSWALKAAVDAATSPDEVDAVVW